MPVLDEFYSADEVDQGGMTNNLTRLGDADDFRRVEEDRGLENDDIGQFTHASYEASEDLDPQHRFLKKGDLVEIEYANSERESVIAVFVQRLGHLAAQCQFYTVQGKWVHLQERYVQYAIPRWMNPDTVDAMIPYLPKEAVTEELLAKAQMFDLSVPRIISAPLVSRMLEFKTQSDEMYRKYASRLDSAHQILAHQSDLKFGSLEQVTARLIGTFATKDGVAQVAYFTVRKALLRGGFAFASDRRSHRLTGFLQVRSKAQVQTVNLVRQWLRDWQDDLAKHGSNLVGVHGLAEGTKYVVDFLEKAKTVIARSRESREITRYFAIGPSKVRREITPSQDSTHFTYHESWTDEDRELIKFIENQACSNMYLGLPRLGALPPLLLQACGMYEGHELNNATMFVFLQELGVLVPYENRIRFDPHLLLPSSQHSKPLENLMSQVSIPDSQSFEDSMKNLRHDWGRLPVFCIDGAGAQEIDDGLSVEHSEDGQHWFHIHIANPTAFFDANAPMARLARHMTETIYMPERAFAMIPRWATRGFLSLRPNRPCLTISAKMDDQGVAVDYKITPGIVRNVWQMTPAEASGLLNLSRESDQDQILRVGGDPPAWQHKPKTAPPESRFAHAHALKTMRKLADKRQSLRRAAGGILVEQNEADVAVWSRHSNTGLGWDPPSRARSREVEGDPVIQLRGRPFGQARDADTSVGVVVREMMLLACEVSAKWCADRRIPILYRGTMSLEDDVDPELYTKNILEPAAAKNNGAAPTHLLFDYLNRSGATVLTTEPLKHRILGLSHYSKATSPLRRYGDMLLHWQIEAAIRHEAETGKSLKHTRGSLDFLPFSEKSLKQVMLGLQARENIIRKAMRYSEAHWLTQLFFRAHYYGECTLPKTFTVYVLQEPYADQRAAQVILEQYSVPVAMVMPETLGMERVKAGDRWEVEIEHVMPFLREILMKPLRLISRYE